MTNTLLGVDTGGTFTDFVLLKDNTLFVHKVLSNPSAPQKAILTGIEDLGLMSDIKSGAVTIIHGTTVATNATLEGKGVRTAYITNKGMKDVLRIGRQTRQELYNLAPVARVSPFVDELMFEIDCRVDAAGEVIREPGTDAWEALNRSVREQKPRAIAINLLFSFLAPEHEEKIEAMFANEFFVSRSSNILPEYREYERGVTTWLNAWIGPLIYDYLTDLQRELTPSSLSIMQSSGLTIAAGQAAERAVNLLLSGPAGGLSGSMFIGGGQGRTKLMTFDMGGTSTDVALLDGEIRLTNTGKIADFPVGVPMADIHTIGAGGGSIAFIDEGGLLQVGPASAGADPGPACYGNGGTSPTVTDANLVLGRLREDAFLGGRMRLNRAAAQAAIAPLADQLAISIEDVALGIVRLANEHMIQALRVISIERGFDPREFTLTCFGGAGGLHFCDLAEALEMTTAIVPIHSGVLSALGMLATPPGRELVKTHRAEMKSMNAASLGALFEPLEQQGRNELAAEGVTGIDVERSLDLRYKGQTFTVNVPYIDVETSSQRFHDAHKRLYGHDLDRDVELLNVRIHMEARRETLSLPSIGPHARQQERHGALVGLDDPVQIIDRSTLSTRETLTGPVLITERHSTTLIKRGWNAVVDEVGNLIVSR